MSSLHHNASTLTCNSCVFFEDHVAKNPSLADDAGLCRFNPPLPVVEPEAETRAVWPVVKTDDWCGHFTADRH